MRKKYRQNEVRRMDRKVVRTLQVQQAQKSTLEQMKRYLKSIKPIAEKKPYELTVIDLQEWLNSIEVPRKRKKLYVIFKDALNKAVKNNFIKENPMDTVGKPKVQRKQSHTLNKEDKEKNSPPAKKYRKKICI